MEALEIIYMICFFLGVGFAVLSAILGGMLGGADTGMDAGVEAPGDVGHADAGHGHFSPWNPMVIALFLASFGGIGLICQRVGVESLFVQLPTSIGGGVVIAGTLGLLLAKLVRAGEKSSEVKEADLVGHEAEVTITIPDGGVGQIAYIMGGRQTSTAQAADRGAIPAGSQVKITKIVGTTFYVERIP